MLITTLAGFAGLNLVLGLIVVVALAILLALETSLSTRRRHRARTRRSLDYIQRLPALSLIEASGPRRTGR